MYFDDSVNCFFNYFSASVRLASERVGFGAQSVLKGSGACIKARILGSNRDSLRPQQLVWVTADSLNHFALSQNSVSLVFNEFTISHFNDDATR